MERKYGNLNSMNFDQLIKFANQRGVIIPERPNSQEVRDAILQWEIDKGLHKNGLRDLTLREPKVDYKKELARVQSELDELRARLEILEARQ